MIKFLMTGKFQRFICLYDLLLFYNISYFIEKIWYLSE